jgi:hypothetical protein
MDDCDLKKQVCKFIYLFTNNSFLEKIIEVKSVELTLIVKNLS